MRGGILLFKKIKSEEGSVMVFTLLIVMVIAIFFALLILFVNMRSVIENAERAVETVAKTRAQALDIPLKEEYGMIEIIEEKREYLNESKYPFLKSDSFFDEQEEKRSDEPTPGYDQAILERDNDDYKSAVRTADNVAKQTGIRQLEDQFPHLKESDDAEGPIVAREDSFCIEVFPLPEEDVIANKDEEDAIQEMNLGCEVTLDNGVTAEIKPPNLHINGRDNLLNKPYISEEFEDSVPELENKTLQVTNAVFVGFAYRDVHSIFYQALNKYTKDELNAPVQKVYRIVYPQIDTYSFGDEGGWSDFDWGEWD